MTRDSPHTALLPLAVPPLQVRSDPCRLNASRQRRSVWNVFGRDSGAPAAQPARTHSSPRGDTRQHEVIKAEGISCGSPPPDLISSVWQWASSSSGVHIAVSRVILHPCLDARPLCGRPGADRHARNAMRRVHRPPMVLLVRNSPALVSIQRRQLFCGF